MRWMAILFVLLTVQSCKDKSNDDNTIENSGTVNSESAEIEVIDRKKLEKLVRSEPERLQVINFWATWCKPCVEELPAFKEAYDSYGDQVDFRLISLDEVENLDTKVKPFVASMELSMHMYLLDDPVSSKWIPVVDPHWDGTIPVTLMYDKKNRKFYAQTFTSEELKDKIASML